VNDLLVKWRHFAYAEMKDPGSYFRLLATATQLLAIGEVPPGSVSAEEVRAIIDQRLGR
jgi:hypothetical protein